MSASRKHTFIPSSYAVIRLESLDVVADIRADLIHCYKPVNSEELYALERLAVARASLLRVARMENGLYTAFLNQSFTPGGNPLAMLQPDMVNDNIDVARNQNRNYMLAEGMSRFNARSKDLLLFLRLQSQTERLYRRALDELDRVLKLRSILPNEVMEDLEPPPPELEPKPKPEPDFDSDPEPEPAPVAVPAPSTPHASNPPQNNLAIGALARASPRRTRSSPNDHVADEATAPLTQGAAPGHRRLRGSYTSADYADPTIGVSTGGFLAVRAGIRAGAGGRSGADSRGPRRPRQGPERTRHPL